MEVASGGGENLTERFLKLVHADIGDPYVYGAHGPKAFDCSGLIYYNLHKIGINAPRDSEEQWAWVQHISKSQLKPGDLIFYQFPGDNAPPGHVVIYAGNNKIIQAPQPGQDVQEDNISIMSGGQVIGYGRVPGLTGTASAIGGGGDTTGGASDATSALNAIVGPLKSANALFKDMAEVVNWVVIFTEPTQQWRIVCGVLSAACAYGAVKMHNTNFALSCLLAGGVLMFGYMALRPWPESESNMPVRPAPYAVEIATGQPPVSGPPPGSHVGEIQVGLETLAGVWAVGKVAQGLANVAEGAGLGAGISSFFGKLFKDAGDVAEEAPDVAP